MGISRPWALVLLLAVTTAVPAFAATPAQHCERVVASALSSCSKKLGTRARRCYLDTGAACLPGDQAVEKALTQLGNKIGGACPEATTVAGAGYGTALTPAGLVVRVREACAGEPASVVARTFGGPQGAVLAGATAPLRQCLSQAQLEATRLIQSESKSYAICLRAEHGGNGCDLAKTTQKVATAEAKATDKIADVCPDLITPIGIDVPTFVARAAAQARCLTATAHGDTAPLSLDCGPRAGVPVPARDVWTQVVLDGATWGTKCGDGSDYAFWVKLAPTGQPVDRVLFDMQGGGVCIFESDCASRDADLFRASDDGHPSTGIFSPDPAMNPFSNWTMVFLPYCTQDVHFGGGATSNFPSITVYRYGGLNVRAALRYVRDVLWQELAGIDPEGYRPDRLTVLFAGQSAGGFGVNYNYHYVLDDLRWAHTTAVPDAGLALDNGTALSVASLGLVVGPDTPPLGWGARRLQAPYCLAGNCAVGPVLQVATAPRLKAVPEQQILNVSNQVDATQVSTTFFSDTPSWINALRTAFCQNQGLTGIFNWFPARTQQFHTSLTDPARFNGLLADGVTLASWLDGAISDPDGVQDRVDEGTLVTDYPGTMPIACLGPGSPSGAFLD